MERNSDILFAHSEEAADSDHQRDDLAVLVDEHIHDLADLVVLRVIDVLLIPMGNGFAVARMLDII